MHTKQLKCPKPKRVAKEITYDTFPRPQTVFGDAYENINYKR